MTLQTPEPLREWRLNASNREAHGIVTTMLDQIDMQPPYQRGTVWTTDQRIALIRSWIMGIPVPAIILNNRDSVEWAAREGSIYGDGRRENFRPTWSVVDGKQRLETALLWFTDKLDVPASWFPPERIQRIQHTDDGPYVSFLGLTDVGRRFVAHSFHLPVVEAKLPDLRSEAELYLLINGGGTPHSDSDLSTARGLAGATITTIAALSSDTMIVHCESRCPDPRHHDFGAPACVIDTPHGWDHQDEYGHTWTTQTVEVLT